MNRNRTGHIVRSVPAALAVAAVLVVGGQLEAAPYTYTIDKSQSQINLTATGNAFGGALTIEEQHASTPTKYEGSLVVEYPAGPLPGGSIAFPGGSAAAADVMRGLFSIPKAVSPAEGGGAGKDPANYGLTLTLPIAWDIPPIPFPNNIGGEIDLGVLESVEIDVAMRDMVFDVTSPALAPIDIDSSSEFDATGDLLTGVHLGLSSGYLDVNGALVLQQENLLTYFVSLAALEAIELLLPDLGLEVSGSLLALEIEIGIGSRLDLAGIPDLLTVANGPTDPGLVEFDPVTQDSTLTLPVSLDLPDLDFGLGLWDLDMNLDGQLVATATLPEPSAMSLLALSGLALLRRRR